MNDRPTTNDALTLRTDRQLIRSLHHSTRYVVAEVVAPSATTYRVEWWRERMS